MFLFMNINKVTFNIITVEICEFQNGILVENPIFCCGMRINAGFGLSGMWRAADLLLYV